MEVFWALVGFILFIVLPIWGLSKLLGRFYKSDDSRTDPGCKCSCHHDHHEPIPSTRI